MLRNNNSYCDYIRFTAGRESSMGDKTSRADSNIALACTIGATVSDPQGYNYQYAISMPRNTGYEIAAISRGQGTMIVSSQYALEKGSGTFSGIGTMIADMHTAEATSAIMQGEGFMIADALSLEKDSAIFDAGARPSAGDIAQEIWMSQSSTYMTPNTMGKKLNDAGDPWNTSLPGSYGTGTAGRIIGTNLDMKVSDIDPDVMSQLVETGLTLQDAMKIVVAILSGKTSITDNGQGSATVKFRDINDTKDRVIADMIDSKRINITLDKS